MCATVVVNSKGNKMGPTSAEVMGRIAAAAYEFCRENDGQQRVEGFPSFGPVLGEMSTIAASSAQPADFKVTTLHASGALVVKECFYEQFSEQVEEFNSVLQEHDQAYNKDSIRIVEKVTEEPIQVTPNKALLMTDTPTAETLASLEGASEPESLETECSLVFVSRLELQINSQLSLVTDGQGSCLYLKAGSEGGALVHGRELFSFGSGTWADGRDAMETMESGSNWLKTTLTWETLLVLDKKRLPSHLASMPCVEKATPAKQLLKFLEDSGEALWLVSRHSRVSPKYPDSCSVLTASNLSRWKWASRTTRLT